jgi:metal-responsive CopG/Arc/MetJ family transcriptional regulator
VNEKKWVHTHFRSLKEQRDKFDEAIDSEFPTRSAALNELMRRFIKETEKHE